MENMHTEIITWYSLLPAVVAIVMAFITRQVLPSLFLGVVTGGLVMFLQTGDIGSANIVSEFIIPAIGTKTYATILIIYLWCIGGITGMWNKTGGASYFAHTLGNKISHGPRSSAFFAWLMGVVFHQGGTISTILAGTTVRPVTDQHRVSHEELSYIVDSTASPVATIVPFNAWLLYVSGIVAGLIPLIPDNLSAENFYLKSIFFNFYGIIAVLMTLLFALNLTPWVGKKMRLAKERARKTGKLDADDAEPLLVLNEEHDIKVKTYKTSLLDFFVPIGTLLLITITPFVAWQLGFTDAKHSNYISEGFVLAALSSMVLAKIKGMSLHEIVDGFLHGCKNMTLGAILLALAITLGYVTQKVHTADFLINMMHDAIPSLALPAILTLLCMLIAFATGTALGTYAVVFPAALPLAYAINSDPLFLHVCFGAVMGGSVFGDQCSPISDTTILSSMFTGCDLMDHVKTQLPIAMLCAVLGIALSTLVIFLH